MPGAGSGELIIGHEQDFMGSLVDADSDGTPELWGAGRNDTITELDLQNQLENLSQGDTVWDVESVKTNFEGAIGIEAEISADVHSDGVEPIVFNDAGTGITPGVASSARIFTGVQYPTGNAQRELLGCIPLTYEISYEQGSMVTYSLTMAYADEEPGGTVDLSTATRASDGSTVPFHGFQLDIDGTTLEDEQSVTLSISDIARLEYGSSPTANWGLIANPSATLDVTANFTEPSRLELARGSSTGAAADTLDSVPATMTLTSMGGVTVSTYNLEKLKPDSYSWSEVLSGETTTDSTTFNVTGQDAVSVA